MMYFRLAAIALFTFLFTVSVMVEPASAVDGYVGGSCVGPQPRPWNRGYKVYRTRELR